MTMINRAMLIACAAVAFGSVGCSNTVRYMTATHWLAPPTGGQVAASGATVAKESPPTATPAPAAPAAPAAEGSTSRVLYLTYWEGTCSGGVLGFGKGCSKGDSQVKRCELKADNSLACSDEKELNKALSTSN